MTAADQVPDDLEWADFLNARDDYVRTHTDEDISKLRRTRSSAEKNRLISIGWIPLGASTWYVLAPPPTNPGHPVDKRP